jgi:8-oxo-dGTP pyrophosphatase MutT (NUDIX family)
MDHKLSCGIVVVRETPDGWLTLLLRIFHHWDFPKGMREPGEEPLQAALREVKEETGLEDLTFDWNDLFFETGPYSKGKVARYYLGKTAEPEVVMGISPETGEPEHHEWRWVSFDAAYDMGSPRVREIVKWARQAVAG